MTPTVSAQQPWWREPTRGQWFTFLAAWLGWVLDAFDFTVYVLVTQEIAREFQVTPTATMWVITSTLVLRLLGGIFAGWAGDRFGRKLPLMLSLVWLAAFDSAIAFAPSYAWIVVLRTLFGFGMGAEWSAGATIAMENWPARSRGIVSGMLQGGWPVGYLLAAAVSSYVVPIWGWRAMFLLAAAPALLVLPIRFFVPESRAYLETAKERRPSFRDLLEGRLLGRIAWAAGVMGASFGAYYALISQHVPMLKGGFGLTHPQAMNVVVAFNLGMIAGSLGWGTLASKKGPLLALYLPTLLALPFLPLFVGWGGTGLTPLALGAFAGGAFVAGSAGVTPLWLTSVFPAHARARAVAIVYQLGSLIAALVPPLLTTLVARVPSTLPTVIPAVAATCLLLMLGGLALRPRDVLRGPQA